MKQPELLIIGGGLIGLLTARELALAGRAVTVLERGRTGQESSWAGGGILSPLHPWRYPAPVTALARWSQAHYADLALALTETTGIDPEWTPSGLLIGRPTDSAAALAWASDVGLDMAEVDSTQVAGLAPGVQLPQGGLWMPQIAQIRNPRLMKALRAEVLRLGITLREACAVSAIVTDDQGRLCGVRTTEGDLPATQVVVAGGAWSGELLAPLGVPVPVAPVRGQMLLYRAEPGLLSHIVLQDQRYLIPRRDGRILVGSTLEHVGFEKQTTTTARDDLTSAAHALLPALADCPIEQHWAGLRPGSPDGVPLIGPHPRIAGLYMNTGHYRNGVVLGLASARLLADQLLGRSPILDPAPYRLGMPEVAAV